MARSKPLSGNAYALLAIAPLFWAGNHIVGRLIAGHVPSGGLNFFRWILVALVILPLAGRTWRQDWAAVRKKPGSMVFLAVTGGAMFGTLQFVALNYTTAVNVAVLNSVAPAFIILAGMLVFSDRVNPLQLVGVTVSLLGVLAIVAQGSFAILASLTFNGGDLLVIFNMSLWAIYSACLRARPNVSAYGFLLAVAIISAAANLPYALWEYAVDLPLQPTWSTVGAVFYAGVCTSIIAYLAWMRGVELIGASRASAFLHLVPAYGAILAWSLLGERLQVYHIVGLALILTGVTLVARKQ